jgi:glycosyltransferase involved in cell wall biosynthesis
MHILFIPSEEYVPEDTPMAAIFQHDQAKLLINEGNQLGALSFRFPFSVRIFIRSIVLRNNNNLQSYSRLGIIVLFMKYIFNPTSVSLFKEVKDGVNIVRCKGFSGPFKPFQGANQEIILEKYGSAAFGLYCKNYGTPDIIHSHNLLFGGVLADYLATKYKIPHMLTEGSSMHVMDNLSEEVRAVAQEKIKSIKHIYSVSPSLSFQLQALYKISAAEIEWMPNVIPQEFEDMELSNTEPSADSEFKFLNVANLIPLKGQSELIKAFAKALPAIPNAKLDIIGGGELFHELNALVKELNLTERVKIHGIKMRNEVVSYMKNCSVLVLPSHYETFGVVLIEALTLGKPILASKCGGPECIVNDGNGLLFEPKDVNDLSEALFKIYKKHESFNSKLIRDDVIHRFGKKKFVQRLITEYKKNIHDNNS